VVTIITRHCNRRNGRWYSHSFDGHCYFKSTDGHESSWSFSLRRINLELARSAAASGGAIIVDSTRQGKKFPDSFTATVVALHRDEGLFLVLLCHMSVTDLHKYFFSLIGNFLISTIHIISTADSNLVLSNK
jgi:Rit1 N-terminal domain